MANNTIRRDIERMRAEYAYVKVEEAVSKLTGNAKKEYKSYCKKVPMLIKINGLAAAFAFIFSKGSEEGKIKESKAYGLIYKQTGDWLVRQKWISDGQQLMKEFTSKPSNEYRAITIEVLSLFIWLRRFAEGLIASETDNID